MILDPYEDEEEAARELRMIIGIAFAATVIASTVFFIASLWRWA